MSSIATALRHFMRDELPIGCFGDVRQIRPGDERLLTATEARDLERCALTARRASGAGRSLARALCSRAGVPAPDLGRSGSRGPRWPEGVVGSIAHDGAFAAAIVGRATQLHGLGVDIEPAAPLPEGVADVIGCSNELEEFRDMPFGEKALFSIKEAVFKAVHPHDEIFLEFRDVMVRRRTCTAASSYGRIVNWRVLSAPRVLAVAWW